MQNLSVCDIHGYDIWEKFPIFAQNLKYQIN